MTWEILDFNIGEYLDGTRLDQLYGNALHARAEASYRAVFTQSCVSSRRYNGTPSGLFLRLDSSDIGSLVSCDTGAKSHLNASIGGESTGIHEVSIAINYGSVYYDIVTCKFYKTEDMDYLSAYYDVFTEEIEYYDGETSLSGISIIGHPETL